MILRDRVPCRLSARNVLAIATLLLVAVPAWTGATPPEEKATPKAAPDAWPEAKPTPTPSPSPVPLPDKKTEPVRTIKFDFSKSSIEDRMRVLGERMEKAFGKFARLYLEIYMEEVGTLGATLAPDRSIRLKVLHDAMDEALNATIPKFGPDSDMAKQILAEQMKRKRVTPSEEVADTAKAALYEANDIRGRLALDATKTIFWANVYFKLNVPAAADGGPPKNEAFDSEAPRRALARLRADLSWKDMADARNAAEHMLMEFQQSLEIAALRKDAGEARKKVDEIKKMVKHPASDPALIYHQRVLKSIQDEYQELGLAKIDEIREKLKIPEVATNGVPSDKPAEVKLMEAERRRAERAATVDAELNQKRIEAEFQRDPQVRAVLKDISATEKEMDRVKGLARVPNEPAVKKLKNDILALEAKYKDLWTEKYDQIRLKMMLRNGKDRDRRIRAIESTIRQLLDEVKELRDEAPEDGRG